MCYETALEFCVSLKETFSNATAFRAFNKFCKGAVIQIPTVLRIIFLVVRLRVL